MLKKITVQFTVGRSVNIRSSVIGCHAKTEHRRRRKKKGLETVLSDYESIEPDEEMVSSLQSRKESLENKLKEKNEELKALCIQEAELTGVLPPETPLEAGESPPVFRRRVGTVFTYPANLINKLKSKEEESLATLELEYNIQSGIAEAARSMANDTAANKAARRKNRLVYQQSQRRLLELEARLNLLRQASRCPLKQRKKPRPPVSEVDGIEMVNGVSLSPVQEKMYQQPNKTQPLGTVPERVHLVPPSNMPLHSYNRNPHRQIQSEAPYSPNWGYQQYSCEVERHQRLVQDHQVNRLNNREGSNWYNTAPTSRYLGVNAKAEEESREKTVRYRDRFGSLDRRRGMESGEPDLRQSPVHRLYHGSPTHPPTVLLPNQTYPENSLMRTQSLGTVDHFSRKSKEKDWFETSLDAGPRPSPTQQPPSHTPIPMHGFTSPTSTRSSEADPTEQLHLPVSQQLSFDTVVPFESPKNHTVVQAGMWQPYREVTKPFEMADFYKYSTKFRKNSSGAPPLPQQKAVYQPLQPMTCQPLAPQDTENGNETPTSKEKMTSALDGADETFSNELLSWYQDQNAPQPRSATLV